MSRIAAAPVRQSAITQAERQIALGGAPVYLYWFCWKTPVLDGRPGAKALSMRLDVDELEGTTRREALSAFLRHGHPETAGEDTGCLDEFVAFLDQEITNRLASGPVPPEGMDP